MDRIVKIIGLSSLVALSLALAGCGDTLPFYIPTAPTGSPPIVRATDRGTAMLTLIACPVGVAGGAVVAEVIRDLQTSAPIVTADARGTARLVINACPTPLTADIITAARAAPARDRR